MATEPHGTTKPDGPHGHDAVEMPEPTVAPLVLSLGMAMFAAGVVTGPAFFLVGAVVLLYGLGLWISSLLPGKGHMHEELAPPEKRPKPIKPVLGAVQELRPGMPGYRVRLPEKVHPISAGIKGGLAGGVAIIIPALLYGIISGHGIWYPVNLLAGMVVPIETMTEANLESFNFSLLLTGLVLHFVVSVVLGLIYGVLLPTLPEVPQVLAWGVLV